MTPEEKTNRLKKRYERILKRFGLKEYSTPFQEPPISDLTRETQSILPGLPKVPRAYQTNEKRLGLCRLLVDLLPKRERRAVSLFYFNDCSIIKIASRMRITTNGVKFLLKSAKCRLRKNITLH